MEVTAAREAAESSGRSSVTEAERRQYNSAEHRDRPPAERGDGRDAPSLKRAPLIPETGGQLSERRPPGTDRKPSERRPPGTDRKPSERRPPGTDREPSERRPPAERRPPGTDGEPSERRPPGTDREPSERRPPGTDREPSERRPSDTDGEPSERRPPGTDGEPSERRPPGTDGEPSERRPPGTDREPSERRPPDTDGEPSEKRPSDTDGEPSERRPPGTDGEPSERRPPGTDGEPSERRPPGTDREPSERRPPDTDGEPSEKRPSDTDGEPSERRPPGTDGEPSERRPPGTAGEPLERRPPGTDGEPSQRLVIVRGRRENAPRSYRDGLMSLREESTRGGYERAWRALSGYELAMPPVREAAPHPISGYERLSVDRAHTMKDFEKQITELKKDNFNLKLRIYFLEEQMQRRCDTSNDELHRMNIELKVEVESLKHDFQEKHNLLVRASKAMESLSEERDLAIQRLREEDLKHLEDMADAHNQKVQVLQAEMAHEKAELEKMCMLLDQERMQRFSAEEKLLAVNEQYSKSVAILEERDWIIQCLNDSVHSKDALITQLEQQIASLMSHDAKDATPNTSHLQPKSNIELLPEAADPVCKSDENVNEWQKKIKEMDNLINELQQKLEAKKAEEKNSLKRDKAIQGLTLAMKKKTKENEKLQNEIGNLNVALSKAQEASQLQSLKENIHPDYKKLIFTIQAEQGMYSRVLKYERESGGLQKELESIAMLRRWLEESIQANQELRKVMEAQIMAKYKGDDSMSFLGDQTSYLSICLDHLDQNEYFFAGGPQRASIFKNNMDIGESEKVFREESGTQTQSDIRGSAGGNLKTQLDGNLYPSFSEKSTIKRETTGNDAKPIGIQNTVSVATQTDPKTSCDRCIPLQDAAADLLFTLEEHNVLSQRPPQMPSHNYEMHRNAKKSRLPVLLKSTLNTKLRTDAAKESNHQCFEKELQIENGLLEKVKCAEMGEDSKNRDLVVESHIPDQNKVDQEQRCPTKQTAEEEMDYCTTVEGSMQAEREIMAAYVRCKDSDLTNAKHTESTEKAKELKAENSQLLEQLKQAQTEIKAFKAGEEFVKIKASENDLCTSKDKQSTGQALQKKLEVENHQLSELLHTFASSEDSMKHKDSAPDLFSSVIEQRACAEQNQRLSEQLQPAQTSTASEDSMKHKNSAPDLSRSVIEQRACVEQNQRLSEQLQPAQTSTAIEDSMIHKDSAPDLSSSIIEQRVCAEQDQRLSEQLQPAQTSTVSEDSMKHKDSAPNLSRSVIEQRACAEQDLQAENQRLSEQLKQAQMEIKTLKAHKDIAKQMDPVHGSSRSGTVHMESTHQALQQELQLENDRLAELLEQAQREIETLKVREELLRHKASELHVGNSKDEQIPLTDLQKELQAENLLLSEQLREAQMKIEMLTTNESRRPNTIPSSSYSLRDQMEPTDQYLNDELQAENYRLSDELKTAQLEIEKLLADKRSDSSDNSLKLHGSDADDDLSEQSLLDKTITNSVNVIEVDATSDFGDEVCRPSVNSQNAAALRCHHDSHCTECANNRGIISLPTLNSARASTMHPFSKFTKVSFSRRSFEETTSLSKYDLLVQSQARELSLQRQKIKESHNLSVICSKNFYNILKFFENLFPSSTLDSNATLEFQEQITQTVEWLKELEYKLSDAVYREEDTYSDQSVDSLLYTPSRLVPGHRMWADKHGCHVLGLVEDYNALRKQMLEARDVLQEMEDFVDHGVQTAVVNMTGHFENIFFDKLTRTKQSLEEAGCLLKLLWRVSLPLQIHSPYTIHQEEEANLEITRLRKRVVAQEKMLSGIVKRVYSENQMKEDIEKLILNQLAMTHDILKRAKGNLEVQVVDKLQ
ncbi:CDK5 regulatory subunit-associated protein 2-like [Ranitomeya imitator]|uniref:CDK5 regulatory subunit-associated protein 2-like n=1 Tax=Ranitomeya imitator TaxID=111125 RepID=UPI0037E99017